MNKYKSELNALPLRITMSEIKKNIISNETNSLQNKTYDKHFSLLQLEKIFLSAQSNQFQQLSLLALRKRHVKKFVMLTELKCNHQRNENFIFVRWEDVEWKWWIIKGKHFILCKTHLKLRCQFFLLFPFPTFLGSS